MKIGDLDIGEKLFLAPMADVTDHPFRTIAKENGAGLTFTQMVSAKGVINNDFGTLRRLVFSRDEKPIGVQILGNDPKILGGAVRELSKRSPDLIDLNCGCPVSKVFGLEMGAFILSDPRLLGTLVKSMVNASNGIPISVKLRLGRDRRSINILENAKAAEDNGASLIILHARTKVDRYCEDPDWDWLKKVKENTSIPVVGNGSIFEPEDIVKMKKETGCDSVMIARGALGNPYIFDRYNSIVERGVDPGQPDIMKIKKTVVKHINLLARDFGELKAMDRIKKNVVWYFRKFNGIEFLLNNIFSINSQERIIELINTHVENIKEDKYENDDLSKIQKKFEKKVLFWLNDEIEVIN